MAKIGYIRVSTNDQNSDLQRNALVSANCEQIFADKNSQQTTEKSPICAVCHSQPSINPCPSARWPMMICID